MSQPRERPVGLELADTAKAISRAFEAALAEAGGSLPTWLILLSLRAGRGHTQRELADAVGVRGATLSHHLDGLEAEGLVARRSDPANRRIQRVELTAEGERAFHRLRTVAVAHDRRLRAGLSEDEVALLRATLRTLAVNVGGSES